MDLVSAAARGHRDCGRLRIFRIRAHSIDAKLLDGFYSGLYPHDPASKSVHKGDAIQRHVTDLIRVHHIGYRAVSRIEWGGCSFDFYNLAGRANNQNGIGYRVLSYGQVERTFPLLKAWFTDYKFVSPDGQSPKIINAGR